MDKQIEIKNWTPLTKNTLRGFCTVKLPSGMLIHAVMLHEKGDHRWISLPAREYTDEKTGKKQFARFIEFDNRTIADRFRDQVLASLDRHFAKVVKDEQQRENQHA
jgi:hypothetical protein